MTVGMLFRWAELVQEEQFSFLGPLGVLYWFSHVAVINLLELAGKAGLRLLILSLFPVCQF